MTKHADDDGAVEMLEAATAEDSFLAALQDLERRYQEMRATWDDELQEARSQVKPLQEAYVQLEEELRQAHARIEREAQRAERHKHRARHLADGVKAIHRAMFSGNVFELILRPA